MGYLAVERTVEKHFDHTMGQKAKPMGHPREERIAGKDFWSHYGAEP